MVTEKVIDGTALKKLFKNVVFIGVGGAGMRLLDQFLRHTYKVDKGVAEHHIFIDLSDKDMHEVTDAGLAKKWILDQGISLKNPLSLPAGAGRTPFLSAYVMEKAKNITKIDDIPGGKAYFFLHSLGGGTGSGATPEIARFLKEQRNDIVSFSFCVFEKGVFLEQGNQALTFPRTCKQMDLVIVFDNVSIRANPEIKQYRAEILRNIETDGLKGQKWANLIVVNHHVVRIVELLAHASDTSAFPRSSDYSDWVTLAAGGESYEKGVRWLVPYLWPLNAELITDFEGVTPLFLALQAIDKGCLWNGKIEGGKGGEAAFVVAEGPGEYLYNGYDTLKNGVANALKIEPDHVIVVCVEQSEQDKPGIQLAILRSCTVFPALDWMCNIKPDDIQSCQNSWRKGIQTLKGAAGQFPDKVGEGYTKETMLTDLDQLETNIKNIKLLDEIKSLRDSVAKVQNEEPVGLE